MKKLLFIPLILSAVLLSGCSDTSSSVPTNTIVPASPSSKVTVPSLQTTETTSAPTDSAYPSVKKSSSGICHAKGSTYYNQTKKFTAYSTIDDCLNSGGRMPKK